MNDLVDTSAEAVERLAASLPRCRTGAPALTTAADTLRALLAEREFHAAIAVKALERGADLFDQVTRDSTLATALHRILADDELCLRIAEGFDHEDAAQIGEEDPHGVKDDAYPEWAASRITCVQQGLRAALQSLGESQ